MHEKVKVLYHVLKNTWINQRLKVKYYFQDKGAFVAICKDTIKEIWIDNNRGGGAKLFMCRELDNKPRGIIRRAGYVLGNDVFYFFTYGTDNYLIKKNDLNELFVQVNADIYINTLFDYYDLPDVLQNLSKYKKDHRNCKIIYYVHDYFCICPEINLMCNGRFCGLDCDSLECNLRYKDNNIDINEWRQVWGTFFKDVDEIVCFSESSKEYISHIYEGQNKLVVKPHDMSYFHVGCIPSDNNSGICIAVVGRVTTDFKGRDVVKEIIRKYGNLYKVVVIGTSRVEILNFNYAVKHYPSYSPNDLGSIMAKERVTHVVFPSLCPETFSYVVSELMMLEIPIWGFDLGAQGEKLRGYKKGRVYKNEQELFRALDTLTMSNKR